MSLTLCLPSPSSSAIEERYASLQCELLLRRGSEGASVVRYQSDSLTEVLSRIETELVLLVTEPNLVPSAALISNLTSSLRANPTVDGATAFSNESTDLRQRITPPSLYLTLAEFEDVAVSIDQPELLVEWEGGDPAVLLGFRERMMELAVQGSIPDALRRVVIARNSYVHRFPRFRSEFREDLLQKIDPSAQTILEFGCGEGALGAAVKARQDCRVVGVELDSTAATVAARSLDAVHVGDVQKMLDGINETFDCIVGGEIIEHLDDPWRFLEALRRVSRPGGTLLLSTPNVGSAAIVSDLLRGRFDYLYIGLLCAGHVRFFTRQTIIDMLEMSGWSDVTVEAHPPLVSTSHELLMETLQKAGIEVHEDMKSAGFYVTAVNQRSLTHD